MSLLPLVACSRPVASHVSNPKERQQIFEMVWKRVNERYYDPKFNGVNWAQVKKRYAPKITAAKSESEFYSLLNQMLGELKQSHFQVIPPADYSAEDELSELSAKGGHGDVGLTVQLIDNKPMITRIEPGSAAEKGGLKPGFILLQVDDVPLEKVQKRVIETKERDQMKRFHFMFLTSAILRGPVGSTVKVTYLDGKDAEQTVALTRQAPKGQAIRFGQLPTIYGFAESRRLPEGIGYVRFNIFMMPLLESIKNALRSFRDAPGIILDLRGNVGGIGMMATPIAAQFYEEDTALGTMRMREGEVRFAVFADSKPYRGTVVILTDEGTASTSEILAAGMQENGRAIVVGTLSAGAALPSIVEKLPGGARLQYAVADFKTPKGVFLEGRGVKPDAPVKITRSDLLSGKDPVLDKAISIIQAAREQDSRETGKG